MWGQPETQTTTMNKNWNPALGQPQASLSCDWSIWICSTYPIGMSFYSLDPRQQCASNSPCWPVTRSPPENFTSLFQLLTQTTTTSTAKATTKAALPAARLAAAPATNSALAFPEGLRCGFNHEKQVQVFQTVPISHTFDYQAGSSTHGITIYQSNQKKTTFWRTLARIATSHTLQLVAAWSEKQW